MSKAQSQISSHRNNNGTDTKMQKEEKKKVDDLRHFRTHGKNEASKTLLRKI